MPTAYAEEVVASTVRKWKAAKLIQCFNEFDKAPKMVFHEVERTTLDDVLVSETPTHRILEVPVQSPGVLVPYINPETYEQILDENGNPVEGMYFTDEQIAYAIACAYIYIAKRTDAGLP